VFKEYSIRPEECVMVGNEILVDLKTASVLGINTIGVNPEPGPDEFMDYKINNLHQIFQIIAKLQTTIHEGTES